MESVIVSEDTGWGGHASTVVSPAVRRGIVETSWTATFKNAVLITSKITFVLFFKEKPPVLFVKTLIYHLRKDLFNLIIYLLIIGLNIWIWCFSFHGILNSDVSKYVAFCQGRSRVPLASFSTHSMLELHIIVIYTLLG